MARILEGKSVVKALNEQFKLRVQALKERGVAPTLAIVRVGEKGDDIAYERGALKRMETVGVETRSLVFPADITTDELVAEIGKISADSGIHGCLILRPLPRHIDDAQVCAALRFEKDVDGITDGSLAGLLTGAESGFPPCTAQACMEILQFYNYDLTGKKATVVGRSLVVGKPAALMLLKKNATVTVCHTKTADMKAACRDAEVLIVAAGRAAMVDRDYMSAGQVVIDVGINVNADGKLCGDVDYDAALEVAHAVTPVPGGVGTVTTSVLAKHVVIAAERSV